MAKDAGHEIKKMMVDGGMTVNNFLLQQQADLTGIQIARKQETEVTGLGAAIAAGLHVGFWGSLKEVEERVRVDRVFESQITAE